MKKLFLLCTLLMVGITMMGAVKKTKLRVLYVGGHSNMETFGTDYDKAENEKSIVERTVSFEQFLKEYFTTVKVVQGKDYNYKMSYDYDVTIMDGVPTPLKERVDVKDGQRFIKIIYAQYFPEDFDRPVMTIAELGETLGRYIGLKSDWYCLCLDNYAHTMRTNHPVVKGPYEVNMKLGK